MKNTFGNLFRLTTFGESHGEAIGGVVDGLPAGIDVDIDFIQRELDRRRPGQSAITTSRKEADRVELLSGVFEGKSTGCPIGFIVRNANQRSADYDEMRTVFRPSHADYTYTAKYGLRDYRGGGRSSARVTISRCVGGALAKLALRQIGVSVQAYTSQVGDIALENDYRKYDLEQAESNIVRCPDAAKAEEMIRLISSVKADGDTVGGTVTCVIKGCPAGIGEPEFDKLHAALGYAMLGINAVKGVEFGEGFALVSSEIGRLADRSALSAMRVSKMVSRMRESVESGLSEMELFSTQMRESLRTIKMLSESLDAAKAQVAELGAEFDSLAHGVSAQSESAIKISVSVHELNSAAFQTRNKAGDLKIVTDALEKTSFELKAKVSQFKLPPDNKGA